MAKNVKPEFWFDAGPLPTQSLDAMAEIEYYMSIDEFNAYAVELLHLCNVEPMRFGVSDGPFYSASEIHLALRVMNPQWKALAAARALGLTD